MLECVAFAPAVAYATPALVTENVTLALTDFFAAPARVIEFASQVAGSFSSMDKLASQVYFQVHLE